MPVPCSCSSATRFARFGLQSGPRPLQMALHRLDNQSYCSAVLLSARSRTNQMIIANPKSCLALLLHWSLSTNLLLRCVGVDTLLCASFPPFLSHSQSHLFLKMLSTILSLLAVTSTASALALEPRQDASTIQNHANSATLGLLAPGYSRSYLSDG